MLRDKQLGSLEELSNQLDLMHDEFGDNCHHSDLSVQQYNEWQQQIM